MALLPSDADVSLKESKSASYRVGEHAYVADAVQEIQTNIKTGKSRKINLRAIRGETSSATSSNVLSEYGVEMYRQPDNIIGNVKVFHLRHGGAGADHQPDALHFALAASQFLYMMQGQDKRPTSVALWFNPILLDNFVKLRQQFATAGKPHDTIWVFHGTRECNIQSIMSGGFKVGGQEVTVANGTAYGSGVYTATGPATPMGYSRDSNAVILAKALPGAKGIDSRSPNQDWVIFNSGAQLLPVYVLQW